MTRDQKIYYYQNLLMLGFIPIIVALIHTIDFWETNERSKCVVVHANVPHWKGRCELER